MISFPTTIVENFFESPDAIREYALSLKYERDEENRWPGLRSKQLWQLNNLMFNNISYRILSLFHSGKNNRLNFSANMSFQIIPAGEHIGGWIHTDGEPLLAAIIYLSPNGDINSGTSFFKLKNNMFYDSKFNQYKDFSKSIKDNEQYRLKNNEQFEETARVGGFYNSAVIFDSSNFHGANFDHSNEDRLTCVVFFHEIHGITNYPLIRLKKTGTGD